MIVNDRAWFWSHRLPLAKAIAAEGAELHVAMGGSKDTGLDALGMTPHALPIHTGSFSPVAQIALFAGIFRTMKNVRPDIVHAITLRHAFYAGLAARLLPVERAVFTIAGLGSFFSSGEPRVRAVRALVAPLLKVAFGGKNRFVIFQNPDDARALVRIGAVTKDKCAVIRGSGVDPVEFAFGEEPANDRPIVLFASRLLKAKGVGEFVHAARILTSKGIAARFCIAGAPAPGNHDSVPQDRIDEWRDDKSIEILGAQDHMAGLLRDCAIVALPSYYGEGVPKILLEAASCGRAIVTTDMPGCREAVEHGVNGLLVPPRNAWDLAEAIETLLADRPRRAAMGVKGRERVEEKFTVEKINARTLAVYRKLMEAPRDGNKKAAPRKAA